MFKEIDMIIEELKPEDADKAHKEFLVKRFQDFPKILSYKNPKTYETIVIVINSMLNMVSSLQNLTYVLRLLRELVMWNENLIKLCLFLVYFFIVFSIVEPEKLKHMTTITMILFMTISNHLSEISSLTNFNKLDASYLIQSQNLFTVKVRRLL